MDSKPLRILCLAGWWPEGSSMNGIFIREHVRCVNGFCDMEVVHMEVIKTGPGLPSIRITSSVEDGISVHRVRIGTFLRRFGVAEWLVKLAYKRVISMLLRTGPFDLVHIHVRTWITSLSTETRILRKTPFILTEHSSFYHVGIDSLPQPERQRVEASVRHWLNSGRLLKILPVSNDLALVLHHRFGVPLEKMVVIPNVAAEVFHYQNEKDPPPPYAILLAAYWRYPKDPTTFINALKLLPPGIQHGIVIEWVGDGEYIAEIKKRCQEELPHIRMDFPGALRKAALADAMRRAHLFVLPTLAENLPCVIIESLCCGTPVLSMNVNGIPELINESNGILVPPADPVKLSGALISLITRKQDMDATAISGNALERFSPESVARRLMNLYVQVIGPEDRTAALAGGPSNADHRHEGPDNL